MIKYIDNPDYSDIESNLRKFISKKPFGRFLSNRNLNYDGCIDYELMSLRQYLNKGHITVAIGKEGNILGLIGYHLSEWDTDIFLKRVAIIKYLLIGETNVHSELEVSLNLTDVFHKWARLNNIDVAITRLDTKYFSPILALQNQGYIIYECVTLRSLVINQGSVAFDNSIKYRFASEPDNEILKGIVLKNAYQKSHFYLDSNFDKARIDLMYSRWIEDALSSNQRIVIIEEQNQIAGVFIYDMIDSPGYFNRKIATWISAFVDSDFRKKGIGTKLFNATLKSCIEEGAGIVDSSLVEKNIISQNLHDRLGFQMVNTLYTMHKWFK